MAFTVGPGYSKRVFVRDDHGRFADSPGHSLGQHPSASALAKASNKAVVRKARASANPAAVFRKEIERRRVANSAGARRVVPKKR